jgi:hypothetical protein
MKLEETFMSETKHLDDQAIAARRAFLKKAGKAAVVTPAIAMLLSAESSRPPLCRPTHSRVDGTNSLSTSEPPLRRRLARRRRKTLARWPTRLAQASVATRGREKRLQYAIEQHCPPDTNQMRHSCPTRST